MKIYRFKWESGRPLFYLLKQQQRARRASYRLLKQGQSPAVLLVARDVYIRSPHSSSEFLPQLTIVNVVSPDVFLVQWRYTQVRLRTCYWYRQKNFILQSDMLKYILSIKAIQYSQQMLYILCIYYLYIVQCLIWSCVTWHFRANYLGIRLGSSTYYVRRPTSIYITRRFTKYKER